MNEQAKKARVGALLFLMIGVLAGHVAATQWFAHEIHYQDDFLGAPLLIDEGMGVKLYPPYRIYSWVRQYRGQGVDDLLMQSAGALFAGVVLGLMCFTFFWRLSRPQKERTAHGSSRWARPEEIERWGLMLTPAELLEQALKEEKAPSCSASIVIGKDSHSGKHYYSAGPEHALVFAPTRSGKGVGVVIPTLLTWTESVVVTDIKGENFQISGWWRSLFSHVVYFNPTDPHSAHYNPLLELRKGEGVIKDAMNLAEILAQRPQGKENPFWDDGAKKLLTATILYVLYTQKEKHLGQVARLLMHLEDTLERMEVCEISEPAVRDYVQGVAVATQAKSENVRGGWAAGADGVLDLWKDPIVARNTSRSDFRLRELQYARHPMSLYLVIPPGDLARLSPLIRLFFQQLTDALTEKLDDGDGASSRHRLLMLLDEFPQFGNMEKVERAIAYTAGYEIRWLFITQGLDQLDRIYGRDNGFLANCHTRLAYRCNDDKNAARLSKLLGETTGFKEQQGESGQKSLLSTLSNRSISEVEFARPLMTPGELQQLEDERLVVLIAGKQPVLGDKVTYYDDPHFLPRFKNKRWSLPTKPLSDFPSQEITHDWQEMGQSSSFKESAPVLPSRNEPPGEAESSPVGWKEPEHEQGEAPFSDPVFKVAAGELEQLAIPQEMTPREATRHLTTRSFSQAHLFEILERAVRAGHLPPEKLEQLRATMPSPSIAPPEVEPEGASELPEAAIESVQGGEGEDADPFGLLDVLASQGLGVASPEPSPEHIDAPSLLGSSRAAGEEEPWDLEGDEPESVQGYQAQTMVIRDIQEQMRAIAAAAAASSHDND